MSYSEYMSKYDDYAEHGYNSRMDYWADMHGYSEYGKHDGDEIITHYCELCKEEFCQETMTHTDMGWLCKDCIEDYEDE